MPVLPTMSQLTALTAPTTATATAATPTDSQVPSLVTFPPNRPHGKVRPHRAANPSHGDPDADGIEAPGNHRSPCRLSQRPGNQCGRGADLPDDELSVPRYRACLEPVRAQRTGQYLHPHHEPDQRR